MDDLRTQRAAGRGPIPPLAGIGLRLNHHAWVMERRPTTAWFEVHAENFMGHAMMCEQLDSIASDYPISLHSVGLSLGSTTLPETMHLSQLRTLANRYEPGLVSDHLAWNAIDRVHLPDLLPLPLTEEALDAVVCNVSHVQETLRREILIENPSKYLSVPHSELTEAQFIAEVVDRTGCGVLLDLNNLHVSAYNEHSGSDCALAHFLKTVDADAIREIHLAGHTAARLESGASLLVDDHGSLVCPEVWALYRKAIAALGPLPTLIEWDTQVPDFDVLEWQASIADSIMTDASEEGGRVDTPR